MLNTRVSTKLACVATVVVFMVFADLVPVAMGCPPPPPMPLRALYNQSVRIVVARVGASKMIRTDDEYLVVRTALHVSSTIKGKDDQTVIFWEHYVWNEDPVVSPDYSSGDTVLVFLTRLEDEGEYTILDQTYGIKRLADAALKVYLQRISEPAKIIEGSKPDASDLVEWLVRCAEEPATRWEGAYELDLSASMLFDDSANSEQDEETPDDGEESGEDQSETHAAEPVQEPEVDEEQNLLSAFAALVTESQRSRLVDALINAANIEEGDLDLMSLVSHWNDPRLVPFLVSQLRNKVDSPPYVAQQMMEIVAEALGDKRLTSLSERFAELPNNATSADHEQATQTETEAAHDAVVDKQKEVLHKFLARVEKKLKQ
jgi:hypothetical protein